MMERRTAERKTFTSTMEFKSSTFESGTAIYRSQGVDISSQGLGFMSDYRPALGMILRVGIPVDYIGITLPLFAEVAWIEPVKKSFRTGLSFLR